MLQIENVTPLLGISSFSYPYGPMTLHEDVDGSSWDLTQDLINVWTYQTTKLPLFLYLRPSDVVILDFQVSQGWAWFWKFGIRNVFSKLHYQVHRGSFYCRYIKSMDRGCGGKIY